jgi:hypothetical protein
MKTEETAKSGCAEVDEGGLVDLVLRYDPGLGQRRSEPFAIGGKREDSPHVILRDRIDGNAISIEASDDRREHRIRSREGTVEERPITGSTEALPRLPPQAGEPFDVAGDTGARAAR